jgi:hypothetical protein
MVFCRIVIDLRFAIIDSNDFSVLQLGDPFVWLQGNAARTAPNPCGSCNHKNGNVLASFLRKKQGHARLQQLKPIQPSFQYQF